jgi:hypothetical protein
MRDSIVKLILGLIFAVIFSIIIELLFIWQFPGNEPMGSCLQTVMFFILLIWYYTSTEN